MKRTAKLVIKYHLFFEMLLVEIRGNTNSFVSFKKKRGGKKRTCPHSGNQWTWVKDKQRQHNSVGRQEGAAAGN